jgi:prevent-host-death family protein
MAYTVHQAKTHFSRLLKEAEAGKEVIVTRGNKPVARIVPIEPAVQARRIPGGFESLAPIDETALDPLTDRELVEYGFGFMLDENPTKSEDQGTARRERAG